MDTWPWPATARSRLGQTIVKGNARKVRRIGTGGAVLAGFAGATADAFTLLERLEAKLERFPDQLERACVELAKDWRTDRYLRRLEAMMAVADTRPQLHPDRQRRRAGAGGRRDRHRLRRQLRAGRRARADGRCRTSRAEEIARRAMKIAADICVYTNNNVIDRDDAGCMETPTYSPREIVSELDRFIVGQDDAKRAVAIALRNRWRRQQLPEAMREEVVPKNILMIGPTGCGKTEIARRLAKLAQAPFLKVEATKFTEVGYVGRDVDSIARDLVDASLNMLRDALAQGGAGEGGAGGRGAADHRAGRRAARPPTRARSSAACCATASSSRRRSRSPWRSRRACRSASSTSPACRPAR